MPRILHVVPSLEGGAGRGAVEIVRRLQNVPGFETRLCVLGSSQTEDAAVARQLPVNFLEAPLHVRSTSLRRCFGFWKLLRSFQPDLIHSHLWPGALTVGLLASRRIPHLVHVRDAPVSLTSERFGSRVRRHLLQRIADRPNCRFVAVSPVAAQYARDLLKLPQDRIRTIINGIDLSQFEAIPPAEFSSDRIVIVSAGRLIPDKGFDFLIRSIAQMRLRGRVCLRIAGQGSIEPTLRALARESGLEAQVDFVGHVHDMPDYLAKSHIFAHGSINEGMSRVLIEAMGAGRPVVAVDHPGIEDVVDNQTTGIIVPRDEKALAEALDALVSNPSLLTRMGNAGRQRAMTQFTTERVVRELQESYDEIIN